MFVRSNFSQETFWLDISGNLPARILILPSENEFGEKN